MPTRTTATDVFLLPLKLLHRVAIWIFVVGFVYGFLILATVALLFVGRRDSRAAFAFRRGADWCVARFRPNSA